MNELKGLTVEQYLAWERDGFLAIEDFLGPEETAAFDRAMDDALDKWRASGSVINKYGQLNHIEQVSNFIEYGEPYLRLMEHPRMMSIMRDVFGDAFVMIDNDIFVKHPGQAAHTSWHRDTSTGMTVGGKRVPFMVKVFYFTADVPYDGGCLSFLPGSRHMRDDQLPKADNPEDMPGHVRMDVNAGTAVLFDGATYHSALNNFSSQTRRSYVYNYGPMFLRTWPGYEPSAELIKRSEGNALRQMLLGATPWTTDPKAFADA